MSFKKAGKKAARFFGLKVKYKVTLVSNASRKSGREVGARLVTGHCPITRRGLGRRPGTRMVSVEGGLESSNKVGNRWMSLMRQWCGVVSTHQSAT